MKDAAEAISKTEKQHSDHLAAMYKLWEKQVFHNINDQISKKLKRRSPDQIMQKLRKNQWWTKQKSSPPPENHLFWRVFLFCRNFKFIKTSKNSRIPLNKSKWCKSFFVVRWWNTQSSHFFCWCVSYHNFNSLSTFFMHMIVWFLKSNFKGQNLSHAQNTMCFWVQTTIHKQIYNHLQFSLQPDALLDSFDCDRAHEQENSGSSEAALSVTDDVFVQGISKCVTANKSIGGLFSEIHSTRSMIHLNCKGLKSTIPQKIWLTP